MVEKINKIGLNEKVDVSKRRMSTPMQLASMKERRERNLLNAAAKLNSIPKQNEIEISNDIIKF